MCGSASPSTAWCLSVLWEICYKVHLLRGSYRIHTWRDICNLAVWTGHSLPHSNQIITVDDIFLFCSHWGPPRTCELGGHCLFPVFYVIAAWLNPTPDKQVPSASDRVCWRVADVAEVDAVHTTCSGSACLLPLWVSSPLCHGAFRDVCHTLLDFRRPGRLFDDQCVIIGIAGIDNHIRRSFFSSCYDPLWSFAIVSQHTRPKLRCAYFHCLFGCSPLDVPTSSKKTVRKLYCWSSSDRITILYQVLSIHVS